MSFTTAVPQHGCSFCLGCLFLFFGLVNSYSSPKAQLTWPLCLLTGKRGQREGVMCCSRLTLTCPGWGKPKSLEKPGEASELRDDVSATQLTAETHP